MIGILIAAPLGKVQAASSVTGADMIALINNWRSYYWPNALIENVSLDSCAQATAEEMARIDAWDHLANIGYAGASTRCAEHGFGGGKATFVTENWAAHYSMTIDILAEYWSDEAHMLPATSQQYRYVGVGIAEAADGKVYYILQAGAISGEDLPVDVTTQPVNNVTDAPNATATATTDATEDLSEYKNPVITSTPNENGSIFHVVQYGQALYDIATYYGVGYETIKILNNLPNNTIYEGQTLLIRLAPTVTITLTRTPTVPMPTRTITETPVPATPRPTLTITPTPEVSGFDALPKIDRQWLGLGLLILSAVGFFVVFFFFFLKKPKPKK